MMLLSTRATAQDTDVRLTFQFVNVDCNTNEVCYTASLALPNAEANIQLEDWSVRLYYDSDLLGTAGGSLVVTSLDPNYEAASPGENATAPGFGQTNFGFNGEAVAYSVSIRPTTTNPTAGDLTTLSGTRQAIFEACFILNETPPAGGQSCIPLVWDQDSNTLDDSDTTMGSPLPNNNVGAPYPGWDTLNEGTEVNLFGSPNGVELVEHFLFVPNGNNFRNGGVAPFGTIDPADCFLDCNSLPVELASFDAELIGSDGYLTWRTETEESNSHFDVERSVDGVNFVKVGEVTGAGTTDQAQDYDFTDANIDRLGVTDVYYRLKQVDFDNDFEYSNIEVVGISGESTLDIINVKYGSSYRLKQSFGNGIEQVDIYLPNGQLVSSTEYGNDSIVDLKTQGLAAGVYMLVINEKTTKRLTIVR